MQLPWVICLVICAFNESWCNSTYKKNILTHQDSVVLTGELLSFVFICMKVCVFKVITYTCLMC